MKSLRTFFSYLNEDRNISVGNYQRLFYVPCEKIPIITLDPAHLQYMI